MACSEPLQASPVIIEDGAFLGSRSIVVEGVIVEKEAVLGANVVLTQSTKIIDVSGAEPVEYKGRVPSGMASRRQQLEDDAVAAMRRMGVAVTMKSA